MAAYGASNPEGKLGLAEFEAASRKRFPGIAVRWAFTSARQRDRLALQRRKSDSVAKALMRLYYEQFEEVAVQPLQIIPGSEYEEVLAAVRAIMDATGLVCHVGAPMIRHDRETREVAFILAQYARAISENDNVLFMAHGARHEAGILFRHIACELASEFRGIHLAAMSSPPLLEDVLPRLDSARVWLVPLLSVSGLHAMRDMAGENEDSWKMRIMRAGHECAPVLKGLIQSPLFADRWLENLRIAMDCPEVRQD